MATVKQLKANYLLHEHSTLERHWSSRWGGTHHQWRKSIFPRIKRFLPTQSILELGCGRGLLSQQLMPHTTEMTLVDFIDMRSQHLIPSAAFESNVKFYQNDGMRLGDIADESIDFAFSFFSLVDADYVAMESYVLELDRVLTSDGGAFIHHSNALTNLDQIVDERLIMQMGTVRSLDVNASTVRNIASASKLEPRIQECIAWNPGCPTTDCFSTFVRPNNVDVPYVGQYSNLRFEDEVRYGISDLSTIYGQ